MELKEEERFECYNCNGDKQFDGCRVSLMRLDEEGESVDTGWGYTERIDCPTCSGTGTVWLSKEKQKALREKNQD